MSLAAEATRLRRTRRSSALARMLAGLRLLLVAELGGQSAAPLGAKVTMAGSLESEAAATGVRFWRPVLLEPAPACP